MAMTNKQAQIADPILSKVAQGFIHADRVGRELFPVVEIDTRSAKIIKFDKKSFMKYNTLRAPGSSTKRVQFGYSDGSVQLNGHSLEGLVPTETSQAAASVPGIDAARDLAINPTMDIFSLEEELKQAEIATDAANYDVNHKVTLAGTDKWTDKANSNPEGDVDTAKEAIRSTTGFYPNVMILSPKDYMALKQHPLIKDQYKHTSSKSITLEMIAAYFEVDTVKVGKSVWVPDEDSPFQDAWGKTVLAYVPPAGLRSARVPSYGYTYRLRGYTLVEQPYHDRNAKSWVYPITDERDVNMTAMSAGFLIGGAS